MIECPSELKSLMVSILNEKFIQFDKIWIIEKYPNGHAKVICGLYEYTDRFEIIYQIYGEHPL